MQVAWHERSQPIDESHVARVERILGKLEQVRRRGLACFGSEGHKFRLGWRASAAKIAAFEKRQGIRLPGCYRAFLEHAGNGGAGPYYGLYALDQWNDFVGWITDDVPPADFPARPCPLRPGRNTQCMARDPADYQGTISLGTQGCSYVMLLIVTGEFAGRVVYADASGLPPYVSRERDFLAWYERWLDELLQGYDTAWFGYGPGGGEAEFFHILEAGGYGAEERTEAAGAFFRLPQLSDDARRRIPLLCGDREEGVRAAACGAIKKFEIRGTEERCLALLEDPAAEVRRSAVWTVMALAPDLAGDAVLRRLHDDSDPDVATTAFFELQKAGRVSRDVLLRVVNESPHGSVRGLAAHAIQWQVEDSGLLVRLLADENPQVRLYATLGMRQLKLAMWLPEILAHLDREQDVYVVSSILHYLGELADPAAVPKLLEWCRSSDDFHRLEALESLAKIGDERAIPAAREMLRENRCPRRTLEHGSQTHIHSISHLARQSLAASPNPALRKLSRSAYAQSLLSRFWKFLRGV